MKKRKIVALVCVATVLLLAVSAFGYVQTKLDKINKVPDTVDVMLARNAARPDAGNNAEKNGDVI